MKQYLNELMPYIVTFVIGLLNMLMLLVKTRTNSIVKKIQKETHDVTFEPSDYLIFIDGKYHELTKGKLIKKSDFSFELLKKEGFMNEEKKKQPES